MIHKTNGHQLGQLLISDVAPELQAAEAMRRARRLRRGRTADVASGWAASKKMDAELAQSRAGRAWTKKGQSKGKQRVYPDGEMT